MYGFVLIFPHVQLLLNDLFCGFYISKQNRRKERGVLKMMIWDIPLVTVTRTCSHVENHCPGFQPMGLRLPFQKQQIIIRT